MINNKDYEDLIKNNIKKYIRGKVAKVQVSDSFIVGKIVENSPKYTDEQVFSICLEALLEVAKGIGALEFLENNFNIDADEMLSISSLKESYIELKKRVYGIYKEHSKNAEEVY